MIQPQILLFFFTALLSQERSPGIFIVMEPLRRTPCENEVRMVIGKSRICISKKPIIPLIEVRSFSDIQYDPIAGDHYIDANLSAAGKKTLNNAIDAFPHTRFALVIKDDVICIFKVDPGIIVNSIRIGEDAELKDLIVIHATLKNSGL